METLRADAVAMLEEAFTALTRERVIPCPASHPYVRVGRDYYGEDGLGAADEPYIAASATVEQVILELIDRLDSPTIETACAWLRTSPRSIAVSSPSAQ